MLPEFQCHWHCEQLPCNGIRELQDAWALEMEQKERDATSDSLLVGPLVQYSRQTVEATRLLW